MEESPDKKSVHQSAPDENLESGMNKQATNEENADQTQVIEVKPKKKWFQKRK